MKYNYENRMSAALKWPNKKNNWPYLIPLLLMLLGWNSSIAQPVYQWAHLLTAQIEYSTSVMTTDTNGNLYVAGSFSGTVDFDLGSGTNNVTSTSSGDGFIAKYDPQSNLIWVKSISGNNYASPWSIAVDDSENVYVVGDYNGTYDFDPSAGMANLTSMSSSYDIFMAKYNNSGDYQWAHGIGDIRSDVARCVAVAPSGDIYVSGIFHGTMDFDPGVGTATMSTGAEDMFLAKYDNAGNYVWAKSMGGSGKNDPRSLTFDSGNNVLVNGFFDGVIDFDPSASVANLTAGGRLDAFIAKYDNNGNYIWAGNPTGTSGQDYNYQVVVDHADNIYLCGRLDGTVDFDFSTATANLVSSGGYDIFLVKYSRSGNFIWGKSMGNGSSDEEGFGLTIDNNHKLIMSGYFRGKTDFDPSPAPADTAFLIPQSSGRGANSIFVASYDTSGNYLWNMGVGASNSRSLIMDRNNNLYTAGDIDKIADFDPGPAVVNLMGSRGNIYIAKYYICSSDTVKIAERICDGSTYIFGTQSITTSGTYAEVFASALCGDSIVSLTLDVVPTDTVVSQAGEVLTARATGVSYQWINCGAGPIAGETSKTFTATANGDYAVVITNGGCSDTSSCYTVTGVGISEYQPAANLQIYPNPAKQSVTINTDRAINVTISNTLGKVILTSRLNSGINVLDINELSSGIYFVNTSDQQQFKLMIVR